jgi:transcriptional regulator with XRE-family HTH domain
VATIHEHADEISLSLGSRLHAMRESRDWTLETLAEKTELSKAYLSRLEAGSRQASITALCAIARAFGVSIAALFEQPDESTHCVIIRGGSQEKRSANGLTYEPLSSSTKRFNLHPLSVTIPADRTGEETYQHVGEEWLLIETGRVRLMVAGAKHILEAGDCAHFDSRLPHRLDALDSQPATAILVACPIPLTLNERRAIDEQPAMSVGQFVG